MIKAHFKYDVKQNIRNRIQPLLLTFGLLCGFFADAGILPSVITPAKIDNERINNNKTVPEIEAVTRLSQVGQPKYPVNFQHVNYVNPDAPKGGVVKIAALARGFDNFNPYITRGNAPQDISTNLFESLTTSIADDPFTIYGLLAEKFKLAADKKSMTFYLNPKARFHNGDAVTADDIIFSYNILIEKGIPQIKLMLKDLERIEKIDPLTVTFYFKTDQNKKLPFIIGGIPIYQQKDYANLAFDEPSLSHIPNATGPYKVGKYDKGRFIEYVRDPNYWGKDLPIKRGQNNFDIIRYEFYFDNNAALEAFKSGKLDIRHDASPRVRETMYESKAKDLGWYKMEGFKHARITFMQGFVFNLKRPQFQDICVRKALSLVLDTPWGIKNYAFGAYQLSHSFFGNSELEAKGIPSAQEKTILESLITRFPNELAGCHSDSTHILTDAVITPANPKSQADRHQNLITAQSLLKQSGWTIQAGQLKDKQGKPFTFELVISEGFERMGILWAEELKKLGINAVILKMDDVQLTERLKNWDFDSTLGIWPIDPLPGEELRSFFGSESADFSTSLNKMSLKNKVVDALIDQIIVLEDRDQQILYLRVLDRVLRALYFVVPHFNSDKNYVASWNKFGQPQWIPTERVAITAALNEWWIDPEKVKKLEDAMSSNQKLP